MENLGLNVAESLETLCKHDGNSASELQGFLSKQIWTPADRSSLLSILSKVLLHSTSTHHVTRAFRGVILDLLCRARRLVQDTKDVINRHVQHQHLCVALSKVIGITPEVAGWTLSYLTTTEPFYRAASSLGSGEPAQKKSKKTKYVSAPSENDLLKATYILVCHLHQELTIAWDWADFMQWITAPDITARWYCLHAVARLLSMSPTCLQSFRKHHFTDEEILQLSVRFNSSLQESLEQATLLSNPSQSGSSCYGDRQSHTMREIVDGDLSDDVTCVCGVILQRLHTVNNEESCDELVMVPSTRRNLHSVALGVATGSSVLLEGPVGCGKTALVEHIARVTGRGVTPHLMKIQLGDQTDSKALVGTYRCTDIPGEFVWQPGVLTTAVHEGHWVLFEDLDYAPMDVISLLLPLLETRTLSVPGHGDQVHAHPDFRIFATLRLLSSGSTMYRQQNAGLDILDQLWTRVTVEPLSRTELQQVICCKYDSLTTVIEKLLDIYFLLTSGKHATSDGNQGDCNPGDDEEEADGRFYSLDGRLISTRDLMKWCRRIAVDFDVSQRSTANAVYQEALDCFCACIAKTDKLLPLAEAIGAKLNITKAKTEYYSSLHKPNIELTASRLTVGRACLKRKISQFATLKRSSGGSFAFTRQAVNLLERVTVCVRNNEPVLLVGETGTGKTSSVQYLAEQLGSRLKVINMNQQSDSTDLLGGFKPVDIRFVVAPFREDFELIFCKTFSHKQNSKFLGHIQECFAKRRWQDLFKLMEHTTKAALAKTVKDGEMHSKWEVTFTRLKQLQAQVKQSQSALAFSFIEGTLVRALKAGDWVLLDEINLATAETLECLSGLLESSIGSIVLMERGDTKPIIRHPDFRLFACMNPATDVGKKDLPPGVRNRFTELYMAELEDPSDLKILVAEYLKGLSLTHSQIDGIVKFYITIKGEASKKLMDGTGHKPCYSLRTLCRALKHAAINPCNNVPRSLYEGFCLSFLTQLDRISHPVVQQLICQHILSRQTSKALLRQPLPQPTGHDSLNFEGFWVAVGTKEPETPELYVLTPSVRANLRDLARVVSAGLHPVLLQGETSVGKTSLITYLAQATGNVCTRINNHEHTDIQEYVGCYSADNTGKLVFKEGVLVEAMRKGYWIILDELNLAPTDVLEALNRLLDDNRELFIAETQETVPAHPRFMLFATQNPPGQYGGRKILSRAFRNRFVELHFSELPSSEIETILHERCNLPKSYSKKLVAVMVELQTRRRGSGVFTGKQGYITLRDLFRWAERYRQASDDSTDSFFDWDQQLANNGYLLLAGRVRHHDECVVLQEVLEKHLKRKVDLHNLFSLHSNTSPTTRPLLEALLVAPPSEYKHVVWTYSMRRMAVLVGQCLKFWEPVLLIGDTGCGKTTICQIFAEQRGQKLYGVNCHMHTEGADFLGGLRPVRHQQDQDMTEQQKLFEWCDGPLVHAMNDGSMFLIDEISLADDSVLERLNSVLEPERTLLLAEKGGGDGDKNDIDVIVAKETFRIVATMNPGGDYGKKELSPALRNRFTEIWCPLSHDRDDMVAIMEHNLWPQIKLGHAQSHGIATAIMDFVEWFLNNDFGKRCTVSIRDILTWVNFINTLAPDETMTNTMETDDLTMDTEDVAMETDIAINIYRLPPALAYIHGACMVFLDALGSGITSSIDSQSPTIARQACLQYLIKQLSQLTQTSYALADVGLAGVGGQKMGHLAGAVVGDSLVEQQEHYFGISPFYIPRGPLLSTGSDSYAMTAPTTCNNAQRLLRALQLPRPMLLEGSPGVGKTSLVSAVAKASGHQLVRINLSEQTDVSDLFGADLPVEGGEGGQFAWRDGPLLQALKAGHWVILDELNLASQSVLEGLNACLDHRGEVYVPELGLTFHIQHDKTRLFACQNPLHQGGGRKGLPRSFLNRFTQVYIEPLTRADLVFITSAIYPQITADVLGLMVDFNQKVYHETMVEGLWGQRGGPWEFNLRDIFRWCELLDKNQMPDQYDPGEYMSLVYTDRMRTTTDKTRISAVYEDIFKSKPYTPTGQVAITTELVQVGHSFLSRKKNVDAQGVRRQLSILHHILPPLESLMKCIEMRYMALLVGPSGTGKTSLVQLLAQLCGHQLHILPMNSAMDTIELLGGFEQMDMNRHLEEVERNTDVILHAMMAQILATRKQHKTQAQKLLLLWHKYLASETSGSVLLASEEMNHLHHKLIRLEDVVSTMVKVSAKLGLPQQVEAEKLRPSLQQLSTMVVKCEKTQHGGTFEWIDSILVKALINGDWLLIDNVNFCSPSVLDRLNALLEPGGVLCINERGVIDGQVPSIAPHPDFRLVLALDHKHGEISRAMRNRGVEIYILGEDEGGHYDSHDVKTMLHGLGLVGRLPIKALMDLHDSVKEQTFGAGRLYMTDLLRVGHLTTQQLERGLDLHTAMYNSTTEVYVRPQRDSQTKQVIATLITEKLSNFDLLQCEVDSHTSSLLDLGLWPDRLPLVTTWCHDVTTATINQHTAVFLHVINQCVLETDNRSKFPLTLSQLMSAGKVLPAGDSSRAMCYLKPALKLLVENVSLKNWKTFSKWLFSVLQERSPHSAKPGKAGDNTLSSVGEVICKSLSTLFEGSMMRRVTEIQRELCSEEHESCEQLPFDLRWNTTFLSMISRIRQGQGHLTDDGLYQELSNLCNQLYLVSQLTQNVVFHTQGLHNLEKTPRRHEASPLQLSYAAHRGLIEAGQLPDASLVHLYPFISQLDAHLLLLFTEPQQLGDNQWLKMKQALMQYEWFVRFCRQPIRSLSNELILPSLSLHWNWLWEAFISELHLSNRLSAALIPIVNSLQVALGSDSRATQLHQVLSQSLGQPSPFPSASAAHFLLRAAALSRDMLVENIMHGQENMIQNKLGLCQKDGGRLKARLMHAMHTLWTEDFSNVEEWLTTELKAIESVLKEHNLLRHAQDMDMSQPPEGASVLPVSETDVALTPLQDHMAVAMEMDILSSVLAVTAPYTEQEVEKWIDFVLEKTSLNAGDMAVWCNVENQVKDGGKLTQLLQHFLSIVGKTTATQQPKYWLSWKAKKLTTMDICEHPQNTESSGPALLHTLNLSHHAFCLLTEQPAPCDIQEQKHRRARKDVQTWLPSNISVGQTSEKLDQLKKVSTCLLSSATCMSTGIHSFSSQSLELGKKVLQNLLTALVPILPNTHQMALRSAAKSQDGSTSLVDVISTLKTIEQETGTLKTLIPSIDTILHDLIDCFAQITETDNSSSDSHLTELFNIGRCWAMVGMFQGFLLAPQGPVDPAYKLAVELDYTQQQINSIECEQELRDEQHKLMTGQKHSSDGAMHPAVSHLMVENQRLNAWIDKYKHQLATRPQPPQFHLLLQDIRQFQRTVCSADRLRQLLGDLQLAHGTVCISASHKSPAVLKEYRIWLRSVEEYTRRLETQYAFYRDLVIPYVTGIKQIQYGVSLMGHSVEASAKMSQLRSAYTQLQDPIESVIVMLCQFPYTSPNLPSALAVAQNLLHNTTMGQLEHILSVGEAGGRDSEIFVRRLLNCGLQHVRNHLAVTLNLDSAATYFLSKLFHEYVVVWHKAEELRRLQEEEQASLYRYKEQVHGDSLTQDEHDQRDMERRFPTFDEEFEDIAVGFTLDDRKHKSSVKSKNVLDIEKEDEDLDLQAMNLTPEEMSNVCHVHQMAFTNLTNTLWHQGTLGSVQDELSYAEPIVNGYQVAAQVGKELSLFMDPRLERKLLGSHLLVSKVLQDAASEDSHQWKKFKRPYDIYHDSDVPEAVKCRPLLEKFTEAVRALLVQWADHPTLKQLLQIIRRVLSFPVTSPLMRFVTGLEMLLQKAQEWESNAAKHVSLSEHMLTTTTQIIEWRKIELRCWQCCLDTVLVQVQQKSSKWWFHLYNLLQAFVQPRGDEADLHLGSVPSEIGNPDMKSLIPALQQYMEGSTLGEYTTRLDMLQAFHYQMVHVDSSPQQGAILRLLWNLHQHYKQFVPIIQGQIAQYRAPIERQLKGFVKIARWNDINYYAVKQAAERTHKTLHKHMKEFETKLGYPVQPLLTEDVKPDWSIMSQSQAEGEILKVLDVTIFVEPVQVFMPACLPSVLQSDIFRRLPILSKRFTKHCHNIMSSSQHSQYSVVLDQFTGEVIESVHELQGLNISKIVDKDRQRSEVKHIHLRKRKALSDLFKYLHTLGLSHRKGLSSLSRGSMESNEWLMAEPLDVSTALQQLHKLRCDSETNDKWYGCDTYYRRCISRRVLFHAALRTPVQELGIGNIERCKGFSEHLTQLILAQRSQLTEVFNTFTMLRVELGKVSMLTDQLPCPQTAGKQWMLALKSLCDQSLDGLNQMVLLLKCCPNHSSDGSTCLVSPFASRHRCKVMEDEQELLDTSRKLQESITVIRVIKRDVDTVVRNSSILTSASLSDLSASFRKLHGVSETLSQILVNFTIPINGQLHPLATTLQFIQSRIITLTKDFSDWLGDVQSWDKDVSDQDLSTFSADVDSFITEMLLVVQKFVQGEVEVKEEGVSILDRDDEERTPKQMEEDDVDLVDGHITNILYKGHQDKIQNLRVSKVVDMVRCLISQLIEWSNTQQTFPACTAASSLLTACVPLLRQYCCFVQNVITEGLSAHRTMSKLLSVLLAIFTELTQQGFCLPAEFSDEMAGEGATDFQDIEGGGLGEGEGVKDVSDQIETEDQLEDIRRKGEEPPEPEDHDEEPNIKAEDNAIEMSDGFDGKSHDMDQEEGSEGSEDEDDQEADLDREMGDLDGAEANKLDEQVWGSDDEDEQDQDDKEDESGPGAGQQGETELVAKDDNEDKTDTENKDSKTEDGEQEDKTQEQIRTDATEYNEDEVDPHYNDQLEHEEVEPMDLPDDLNLDDQEAGANEEDGNTGDQEDNPQDIDKMLEDAPEETAGTKEEETDQGNEEQGGEQEEEGKEQEPEDGQEQQSGPDQANDAMEIEEEDKEGEKPNEQQGTEPKDDNQEELAADTTEESQPEGIPESAQHAGKTSHDSANAEQSEMADAAAGENDQDQQNEGMGLAETDQDKGHQGQDSTSVTRGSSQQDKVSQRRPGQSSENRSTCSTEDKVHRRLHTVDTDQSKPQPQGLEPQQSDLYEHIKESEGHHDTQTLDVAGAEEQQAVPNMSDDEAEQIDDQQEVHPDDNQKAKEENESELLPSEKLQKASKNMGDDGEMEGQAEVDDAKAEIDGEKVQTSTVSRGLESSIHVNMDLYYSSMPNDVDLEKLRAELEEGLSQLTVSKPGDLQEEYDAQQAWSRYEMLTANLSQELCEQLRLVLEPTQASKLRGDFRTGKRLNMRKVIPYIASQFRKDKIWLRRTKPSKRQYQVMLAIDDSSSMADNHSKQLAFESMSMIANALTLLEVGELSICSFGESVKLLHSFQDQFSSQSGARILQQFTFEQKKTKIAELLNQMTIMMMSARSRQHGIQTEISQLLLVVSDGRGLFLEGVEVVKSAVRRAREANVFLVFVIIDNPDNKDSILDIRVPVFKASGQLPEIKSYMDHFPFPFYIILRDINSLPHTLSDALRQWFELVTAHDR